MGKERVRTVRRVGPLSERHGHHGPRRLVHWINPIGKRNVHSLVDKVQLRKNLEIYEKGIVTFFFPASIDH